MRILLILILTALVINVNAQDKYGVYGNYNLLLPQSEFDDLPEINDCCPEYKDHKGNMFEIGAFYRSKAVSLFDIQVELGYAQLVNNFHYNEYIGNGYDEDMNTVQVFSDHNLDVNFELISFNLIFLKEIANSFNLTFGLKNSYIFSHNAKYQETIDSDLLEFTNGSKDNNKYDGELENISKFQNWLSVGLSKEFVFEKGLIFEPFVNYNFNTTNILSDLEWNNSYIALGASIAFLPTPKENVKNKEAEKDDIIARLQTSILGKEIVKNFATITVEEHLSQQVYPLLPYIFFDEGSSTLPLRYKSLNTNQVNGYDYNKRYLNEEVLEVYYDLINIVGYRLNEYKSANITLIGCNADINKEKGNTRLSQSRAETIKNYLTTRWNIDPSRINIEAKNLSDSYSKGSQEDHHEENRRVEILASDVRITAPVIVQDTLRIPDVPEVGIKMFSALNNKESEIDNWNLSITQNNDKVLGGLKGWGNIDTSFVWKIAQVKKDIPKTNDSIDFELTSFWNDKFVKTNNKINIFQKTVEYKKSMRVENDKKIDEYRLIMFDHNSANLKDEHKFVIGYICKNSEPYSEIIITGYTDFMGDETGNKNLSQKRADAIKNGINCLTKITAKGYGENEMPNISNYLPEGRFYNRTVNVRIETPIEY